MKQEFNTTFIKLVRIGYKLQKYALAGLVSYDPLGQIPAATASRATIFSSAVGIIWSEGSRDLNRPVSRRATANE